MILAHAIAFLIDEPLRRYTEANMNHALKGYTARIGKLDFHPIGLSLDLGDVVVTQDAYPDPPILRLERLSASVHWRALLSAALLLESDRDVSGEEGRPARRSPALGRLTLKTRALRDAVSAERQKH